jgi:hypothetical protein
MKHLYHPPAAVDSIINDNRTMYEFAYQRSALNGTAHLRKALKQPYMIE